MEKWYAWFDTYLTPTIGGKATYLQIAYRGVFAVVGSFLIWFVLKRILHLIENRIQKYEFIRINSQIFRVIHRAFLYVLVLLTGSYLLKIFKIVFLEKVLYACVIVALAGPMRDFLILLLGYLKSNLAARTETKVDDIIFDLLNKFVGVIVYSVSVVMALDILGVNIMPFIAGAGVAGIAIGFAAKDTLSNIIAGILLIIDRPFEVGDRIEIWSAPRGSATWGDVIDIGLRATKINTTDNIVIIIPNNEIMKRDIVNYTILSEKIRVRINIGIAYDADLKKAKEIITDVAGTIGWVAEDPAPKVVVRNFGESSVDLQLRVWITNARKRMDTISDITDKVKEAFDAAGIEIPFPKRDIHIIHRTPDQHTS